MISLSYAVETTAGVRPNTGYINIPMQYVPEEPMPVVFEPVVFAETGAFLPDYETVVKSLSCYITFEALGSIELLKILEKLFLNTHDKSLWFRLKNNKLRQDLFFKGKPMINNSRLKEMGIAEVRIFPESAIEVEK